MPVKIQGMAEVQTVLRLAASRVADMSPITKVIAQDLADYARSSFATASGPGGPWAPKKDGSRAGIRTGAMKAGQTAIGLPTGVQLLSEPFYTKFFKSGTKLGNRAAGARKAKGDRTRRKRGTSQKGTGAKVQPSREISPVAERGGKAIIFDRRFFDDHVLAPAAAFLAGKGAT